MPLLQYRNSVSGSHIGGIESTQECIDLCAKAGIFPDTVLIEANQIDWAYEQLTDNKDGVRYVIDIKKSLENKDFLPSAA